MNFAKATVYTVLGIGLAFICLGCASYTDKVAALAVRTSWRAPGVADDTRKLEAKQSLERMVTRFGIELEYVKGLEDSEGVVGMTIYSQHQMKIAADLSDDVAVQTIAHEMGHILAPAGLTDYNQKEWFAELVAAEVCHRIGIRTLETSARYLADRKSGYDVARLYREEIQWAATVLSPPRFR